MTEQPSKLIDPPFSDSQLFDGLLPQWQQVLDQLSGRDWDRNRLPALARTFLASNYFSQWCRSDPEGLLALINGRETLNFNEPEAPLRQTAGDALDPDQVRADLRIWRNRALAEIIWRDIGQGDDTPGVLRKLSAIANACLEAATVFTYQSLVERYGKPLGRSTGEVLFPVLLGLGKLGGAELNFSSDIDLIVCYCDEGETDQGLSAHEFFLKFVRRLIPLLSDNTADGFVYRTDLRLRPNGNSGPLVLSFDAMEHYYATHGRTWERYALIKASVVAGDQDKGQVLLDLLRPFIYRKYLDYRAFESIRNMNLMITEELNKKGSTDNIKLGPGGIREIEFIAQSFQLIKGGRYRELQSPSLYQAYAAIKTLGILPARTVDELVASYNHLRKLENRLQMINDQQVHSLPTNEMERARIAVAMGFADWGECRSAVDSTRERVQNCFDQIIRSGGEQISASASLRTLSFDNEANRRYLSELGFSDPPEIVRRIATLGSSHYYQTLSTAGREWLDRLLPLMLEEAGSGPKPENALRRLFRLIDHIGRRPSYLALLVENPIALKQVTRLCAASEWLSNWLAMHPILLDELVYPVGEARQPEKSELQAELRNRMQQLDSEDLESKMELLRYFHHSTELQLAAAQIAHLVDPEYITAHLSDLAEVVLDASIETAESGLAKRFGRLKFTRRQFAIVAYGKLGSRELGYGSDLDLIFIYHDDGCDDPDHQQTAGGLKTLDQRHYYGRLVQRIVHLLTTRTAAGLAYEVDMRLRPSGNSGTLITTLDAFRQYQLTQAWTWEHQALVRSRVVAGASRISRLYEQYRRDILCRRRDSGELKKHIAGMRAKMINQNSQTNRQQFDLKLGRGGLVDIEFIVQYAVLALAFECPDLTKPRGVVDILQSLRGKDLLEARDIEQLIDTQRRYTEILLWLKLQNQPALVEQDELAAERKIVRTIWQQLFTTD